jgi:transcriptional regulator with XRE-family HTH domain
MVMERRIELGEKIKKIREQKGLSREEVAFRCGFSGSYMGMIERAEYDFKISKLFSIAQALNIDIKELF